MEMVYYVVDDDGDGDDTDGVYARDRNKYSLYSSTEHRVSTHNYTEFYFYFCCCCAAGAETSQNGICRAM